METLPECNCPSLYPLGCFPILLPLLQLMGFSFFSRDSFTFVKRIVEKIRAERDGGSHQVCTDALDLHVNHQALRSGDGWRLSFFSSFRNLIFFSIWSVLRRATVFTQWHHTHGAHTRAERAFSRPPCRGLTDHEIVSQLTMFLSAGYETSTLALTLSIYSLATTPGSMTRLQEEVDATFPDAVRLQPESHSHLNWAAH